MRDNLTNSLNTYVFRLNLLVIARSKIVTLRITPLPDSGATQHITTVTT